MEYLPYTYLIGWTNLNKWYYGVEYGYKKSPCANPKNFWATYFTSSKIVSKIRELHGEPDVMKIRKIFNQGTIEERMEKAISWEKRVLTKIDITKESWLNGRIGGDICPATNKKIARILYGVDNVFQSDEIKEKIKKTNLKKYGVEHPSHSAELLERKKQNNIKKYGVSCTLTRSDIVENARASLKKQETKDKRKSTNFVNHGVEFISQTDFVKEKVSKTRSKLSNRYEVKLIREYKRVFNIKLPGGWYQTSENTLNNIIEDIQKIYGVYTLEELSNIKLDKKYSSSIKKLQNRPIVKEIKKYKELYGRKIILGRCWDRKKEDVLMKLLQNLIEKYGIIIS